VGNGKKKTEREGIGRKVRRGGGGSVGLKNALGRMILSKGPEKKRRGGKESEHRKGMLGFASICQSK